MERTHSKPRTRQQAHQQRTYRHYSGYSQHHTTTQHLKARYQVRKHDRRDHRRLDRAVDEPHYQLHAQSQQKILSTRMILSIA